MKIVLMLAIKKTLELPDRRSLSKDNRDTAHGIYIYTRVTISLFGCTIFPA